MAGNEEEEEAVKYVWEGAIPMQIHLHKSEVASHPAPPPSLAAYIINGNCKNVMNMSQSDQEDLWTSVMNGKCFTLRDAVESLLPEYRAQTSGEEGEERTTEEANASGENQNGEDTKGLR